MGRRKKKKISPTFSKFAMPLIRQVYPSLIANSLVSIQPMSGPVSLLFYTGLKSFNFNRRITRPHTIEELEAIEVRRITLEILYYIAKLVLAQRKSRWRIKHSANILVFHESSNSTLVSIIDNKITVTARAIKKRKIVKSPAPHLNCFEIESRVPTKKVRIVPLEINEYYLEDPKCFEKVINKIITSFDVPCTDLVAPLFVAGSKNDRRLASYRK